MPATGFVFCKVTFLYGETGVALKGNPGREALPVGASMEIDVKWRDATLRYDGERAGCFESKHRVARPPFVVSEISDSKAAPGKPAARAKTGGNCPRRGGL